MSYLLLLWLGTAELTLTNGLRMHYDDSGTGEAIVLISGLASRLQSWDAVTPMLAKHLRVIRPDNRGVGGSGDLDNGYGIEIMAKDVALLMEGLGIEHYHVAGISLGSFAAQSLALQYPDRVGRLILIASSAGGGAHVPPGPETLTFFQTFFNLPSEKRAEQGLRLGLHADFIASHPETFKALVAAAVAAQTPQAVLRRQGMAGLMFDHSEKARKIAVPTLILHGENDRVVPPQNGQILHGLIPNSRWHRIGKSGHISIIDQPEATAYLMLNFLQEQ